MYTNDNVSVLRFIHITNGKSSWKTFILAIVSHWFNTVKRVFGLALEN